MFINEEPSLLIKPIIKTEEAIKNIRKAATIAHNAIDLAFKYCVSGVNAFEIDKKIEHFIKSQGAIPANFEIENYGYASSISVGNEIAHGIPTRNKVLIYGKPVCVDIGVNYNGYYADCARTKIVRGRGLEIQKDATKLISACKKTLEYAIYKLKPNIMLSEYGKAIEHKVREYGFTIIKSLTGHGVGYEYHEAPYIFNFYHPNNDVMLEPNMVLALELMITNGSGEYIKSKDGWTLLTVDNSLSAHFEHTVLITNRGVEVLGLSNY